MNVFTLTTLVMAAVVMMTFANHVVEARYGGSTGGGSTGGSTGGGSTGGSTGGSECIDGDKFKAPDGCNWCVCISEIPSCTKRACPHGECIGDEYFMALDGCNTCRCINGDLFCTRKYCAPVGGG